MPLKAQATKEQIDTLGFTKTKRFVHHRILSREAKINSKWEKIFENHVSDRGWWFTSYKELSQLNKKTNNPIRHGDRIQIDILPEMICQWPAGVWKGVWHETQVETVVQYCFYPLERPRPKRWKTTVWGAQGESGSLRHHWSEYKIVHNFCEKPVGCVSGT